LGNNRSLATVAIPSSPSIIFAIQSLSKSAVRDTIRAVFAQRAYDRSVLTSIWDRIIASFMRWLGDILNGVSHSGAARQVAIILIVVLLVVIAVRIVLGLMSGDLALRRVGPAWGGPGGGGDAWADAQRLAASGRFTDAAHALYAALLRALAARDQVRIHPSKTVGDYGRELRRRSSALVPPFREFARSYEVVIYGLGHCDRERYDRLYALARTMLPPRA
jgi:hypothetical protein